MDFNPRSPWGERLSHKFGGVPANMISIHAPRGGSDVGAASTAIVALGFQSTLPVGGATCGVCIGVRYVPISIHAPRGGSDEAGAKSYLVAPGISIHAPRGGSDYQFQ